MAKAPTVQPIAAENFQRPTAFILNQIDPSEPPQLPKRSVQGAEKVPTSSAVQRLYFGRATQF